MSFPQFCHIKIWRLFPQKKKLCHRNGLRLIAVAWETFGGFAPETCIMIRKIAIRHADKHNRPRGQTIYQINQRLSVALQRGVGEQLIACKCAG